MAGPSPSRVSRLVLLLVALVAWRLGYRGSCLPFSARLAGLDSSLTPICTLPFRVVMGVTSIAVWAWPWARARSLWAPWVSHTLGDFIGDTFLKL